MWLPGCEARFFSRATKISPARQKRGTKLKEFTFSSFDVIIRLVISDKLEWSPEPHLKKFLRFHVMISSIGE